MARGSPDAAAAGSFTSGRPIWPPRFGVFLSFKGSDTRAFTDHLYAALVRKGILAFKDEILVEKGDFEERFLKAIEQSQRAFTDHLYAALVLKGILAFKDEILEKGDFEERFLKAIEQSQIAIVVLSINYFASSRCLDELLTIMESEYNKGQTVFPVFYGIDPSDLRDQKGSIAAAFEKHEAKISVDKVRRWKEALTKIAELPSNWVTRERYEVDLIEDLIESVWNKLYNRSPSDFDYPVGDILSWLATNPVADIQSKVRGTIELSWLTTIDLSHSHDIMETPDFSGTPNLEKLFLNHCVNLKQVHESVGQLKKLVELRLQYCPSLETLPDFSGTPNLERLFLDDCVNLKQVHESVGQLKKLVELLLGHCTSLETLPDFSGTPNLERLFLDHCVNLKQVHESVGQLKKLVELRLGHCTSLETLPDFSGTPNLERLFLDHCVNLKQVHESVGQLKKLVELRLGDCTSLETLPDFSGTPNLERLFLSHCVNLKQVHESVGQLKKLVELRLGHCTSLETLPDFNGTPNLERLFLDHCVNLKQVLESVGQLKKLVELRLGDCTSLETLLDFSGTPNLEKLFLSHCVNLKQVNESVGQLKKLVELRLGHCTSLETLPDFSGTPNLERLFLDHCVNLKQVHESVGQLKKLVELRLGDCTSLETLPDFSRTPNLEKLFLYRCVNLKQVHESVGQLKKLVELRLGHCTSLETLPDFSGTPNLERLFLDHCVKLKQVHESVGQLKKLVELSLEYSPSLETLPDFSGTPNLEKLFLSHCVNLKQVHESVGQLKKLVELRLGHCTSPLPDFSGIPNLERLFLYHCVDLKQVRESVGRLKKLVELRLEDCTSLETLPDFSGTPNLERLFLYLCFDLKQVPESVGQLKKLVELRLEYCPSLETLPDFSGTPNLERLFLYCCVNLKQVHESVGQLKKLVELRLGHCTSLETLPTCLDMNNLEVFILNDCSKLQKLPEFGENMRRLYFIDVRKTQITGVPSSIINLENLKYLDLSGCRKLQSIPQLPPNSIIRADKDSSLASTFNLQHLIESKHPSVADNPIHLVFHSNGKEDVPPWFEQQELRRSKDKSGEVVTITADIPSDLANSEGECWGIAVCIIFECPSEEAWRGFAVDWKFQDYPHTNDKKGGRPLRTHADAGKDQQTDISPFGRNPQDKNKCRFYKGFFPLDKEKCRQHPSGEGGQVHLTLSFPTTSTVGKMIIYSKKTSFGDLEIVDGGWRLVCKKDFDAGSARIRHEAEVAEESTEFVGNKLVGDIRSKADRIISLLKMELNDTCFIGIWGESGIGKTTLARHVYDEIQSKFDATCFLDNVRTDSERAGIVSLQKKLLSELGLGEHDIDDFSEGAEIIRKLLPHKKVLIILDDVSQRCRLENLAGNKRWFGTGSKIVIITDNKTLLTMYEQFEQYEVERLHPDESLRLLSLEAFKKDEPEKGYLDLSKEVIEYVCGLPLVLKVLGSFLSKKDQNEWENASERLRQNSSTDISSQLRISYDGLEDEEYKRIFLDIACFFNREPKLKVTNILASCGPQSTSGIIHAKKKTSEIIKALIEKSMLNVTRSNSDLRQNEKDQDRLDMIQKMRRDIFLPTYLYDWLLQEASKEYLYMHDLLQEMGKDIVSQESPTDAGGCSRLWSLKDINDVLKENKGTGNVECIVLNIQQSFEADWHPDCLSNMKELKLLDLSKVHLSRNLNSLPSALKIMRWEYYPLESLPPVDQLHELESLQLCNSKITKLWNEAPALGKLRIIDLSDSECLETPDFSGTPNLEELVLNRCRKLVKVHESVGQLKKLVKLRLEYCRKLTKLPPDLEMDNLAEFIISGCVKLEKLPTFGKNMKSLYFFDVEGTSITEIPQSIIRLTNLKYLDLSWCNRLKSIGELPPNLIISASNCRWLEPTSALRHLYASCAPKGPIHLFYDFQLLTRIPTWFEKWQYCWGKDTDGPTSGEFITITADIPSNVVADSNREHWGIAVCVAFQSLSQAWLGFSINWNFEDKCHPKKTKIHGTPAYYMHDCRVYIGFYPFEAKDCRQHASGEGSQLDLTLEFPATNIIKGLHDLEIMGCGWRLACKKHFDEWTESGAPSPPRLDFLNR